MKKLAFLALLLAAPAALRAAEEAPEPEPPRVRLEKDDRLLILAPHPDDEILCCGGVIQEAVSRGIPVRVVFLTHGDNNQWAFALYNKHLVLSPAEVIAMGELRRTEALAAGRALGLAPEDLVFLGYPDFGIMSIWQSHWGEAPPFRHHLTQAAAVPYPDARRPGALYKGEELLKDLTETLREFKPTKVFVSHPADEMPDHRILYLFLRVALWDMKGEAQPQIFPYLVHFQFRRWPQPKGLHEELPLLPPVFFDRQIQWLTFPLDAAREEKKRAALAEHKTQMNYSAGYLLRFVRTNELFGDYPTVLLEETSPPALLSSPPPSPAKAADLPGELTDEERGKFVGLERKSAALEDGELVLRVSYSRPLVAGTSLSIYVFGYKDGVPFGRMPKLHVKFGAIGHHLYDGDRVLPMNTVKVRRTPRQVTIRVPLAALGDPDRLMTSARTYLINAPLDWLSWRILEVKKPREGEAKPR